MADYSITVGDNQFKQIHEGKLMTNEKSHWRIAVVDHLQKIWLQWIWNAHATSQVSTSSGRTPQKAFKLYPDSTTACVVPSRQPRRDKQPATNTTTWKDVNSQSDANRPSAVIAPAPNVVDPATTNCERNVTRKSAHLIISPAISDSFCLKCLSVQKSKSCAKNATFRNFMLMSTRED